MRQAFSLRWYWLLLVAAFVCGGVFEVIDNLLGLRQLNFESSAPAVFKITKELVVWLILARMTLRIGVPRPTVFGIRVVALVLLALLPQMLVPPARSYAFAGLAYFVGSIVTLLYTCAVYRRGMERDFAVWFLGPVILVTLATQLLEAFFAPSSFYYETNLLGLDRRAGIAAIPTTAGLLGVYAFVAFTGWRRVVGLLVIAMANSSLSLLSLLAAIALRARRKVWLIIAAPFLVGGLALLLLTRSEGLAISVGTRLAIVQDTLSDLRWFVPSAIGALATAKSVALSPFDSVIVDSLYLEVLHVCGIVPGLILIGALFATVLRRSGALPLAIFAISGLGFLTLEAWIVWFPMLLALRPPPVSSPHSASAVTPPAAMPSLDASR